MPFCPCCRCKQTIFYKSRSTLSSHKRRYGVCTIDDSENDDLVIRNRRGNNHSAQGTGSTNLSGAHTSSNVSAAKNKSKSHRPKKFKEEPILGYVILPEADQEADSTEIMSSNTIEVNPIDYGDDDCPICLNELKDQSAHASGSESNTVVLISKCKHKYHKICLKQMLIVQKKDCLQCPTCKSVSGVQTGNCPSGTMRFMTLNRNLPHFDCATIEITYTIKAGFQNSKHPNPGIPYVPFGFPRVAYLPCNDEGKKVLKLLEIAWKRRLTFTIGTSITTGLDNSVVWNEIHHKTDFSGNYNGHGFPDPNYFSNVIAELAAQGVTEESLLDCGSN